MDGFNIYRSKDKIGPIGRISSALRPRPSDDAAFSSYGEIDEDIHSGHAYHQQLEDVDYDDFIKIHEQISVTAPPLAGVTIALLSLSVIAGLILIGLSLKKRNLIERQPGSKSFLYAGPAGAR